MLNEAGCLVFLLGEGVTRPASCSDVPAAWSTLSKKAPALPVHSESQDMPVLRVEDGLIKIGRGYHSPFKSKAWQLRWPAACTGWYGVGRVQYEVY